MAIGMFLTTCKNDSICVHAVASEGWPGPGDFQDFSSDLESPPGHDVLPQPSARRRAWFPAAPRGIFHGRDENT